MSSQSPPPTLAVGAALRHAVAVGTAAVFRARHPRHRDDPSCRRMGACDRAIRKSRSAHRPVVRHPHTLRFRGDGSLQHTRSGWRRRLEPCWRRDSARSSTRASSPSVATCSAVRSRIVTLAPFWTSGRMRSRHARRGADRVASIIELLRVAALSSYENRPISVGVLLLGTSEDPLPSRCPCHRRRLVHRVADDYQKLLPTRRWRAHGVPRQLRRTTAGSHRYRAMGHAGLPEPDPPGPVRQSIPAPREGDVAKRTHLRGAEPVARNQSVRRRRRTLHVQRREVAPPRSAGQIPLYGRRRP